MAIDTKMRYNPEVGEVELVYGDSVAFSSGKAEFESWAKYWAAENGYVHESEIPKPEVTPVAKENEPGAPAAEPVQEVNPSEGARPGEEEKNADNASQEVDSDS